MAITAKNPDVVAGGIEFIKKCIDITAELGGAFLTGTLYGPFGVRPERTRTVAQWEKSTENLQLIAQYASSQGIVIGIEPLNRYEHFCINTVADAVLLIQNIGESNIKVHLDTYHMNIEKKDFNTPIVAVGKYIRLVHYFENDCGTPGTSHINSKGLHKNLLEIYYSGWLVLESFFEPIPEIADFTPIWRELAPSADTLAREGINLIKKTVSKFVAN